MRRYMHSRRRRPDPLPPTLWGWIVRVWKIKQDDVIELAGYDAAMYLRILAFGAALEPWSCAALTSHCTWDSAPGLY